MSTITRKDGTHLYFKDWGKGPVVTCSHGWPLSSDAGVALAGDRTIIVPGHGPVGDRSQLKEFGDMLVAVRNDVATLKKQGKSSAEVVAAKPTAAYDTKWGQFVIDPAFFTRIVYDGL